MIDDILELLPDFETLLRNKCFAELNSSEKSIVLKFMTIEEYDAMKSYTAKVIETFVEEEKYLLLDKNLENVLLHHLREKREKHLAGTIEFLSFILLFKIPAYQVVILIIVGLFLIPLTNQKIVNKLPVISKTDTVFIGKSINNPVSEKNNIKTVNIYTVKRKPFLKKYISKFRPVLRSQNSPYLANIVTHFQNEKIGHPIESDSSVFWRLVTVQSSGN